MTTSQSLYPQGVDGIRIGTLMVEEHDLIKVRSASNVKDVAKSIMKGLQNSPEIKVRAIGAGSVNQATKAIAIARGMLAPQAQDLWCRIGFATVVTETNESISALVFICETR